MKLTGGSLKVPLEDGTVARSPDGSKYFIHGMYLVGIWALEVYTIITWTFWVGAGVAACA